MRRALPIVGSLLAAVFLAEAGTAQCAMCRTALESPEAVALAAGFQRGVLFLLLVPFAALGVIAGLILNRIRGGTESERPVARLEPGVDRHHSSS